MHPSERDQSNENKKKKNWPANAPHQEAGRSIRLEFSYSFRSLTCVLAERELHVQQPVVSPNHGRRVCVTHKMLTKQCYLKLFNESYLMIFFQRIQCVVCREHTNGTAFTDNSSLGRISP